MEEMTPEAYTVVASALLSLAAFYLPFFAPWYEKLEKADKQLVMLGFLFLAVAGKFALACLNIGEGFTCDQYGAMDAVIQLVYAAVINSGVYKSVNYVHERGQARKLEKKIAANAEEAQEIG